MRVPTSITRRLLDATDYRSFLRIYFDAMKAEGHGVTFRQFAEAAGLKSPAFAREVMLGKKRLTLNSLDKFTKGMGLPADIAEFFRLLVLRDEPTLAATDEDAVAKRHASVRKRIERKRLADPELERLYSHRYWPTVYAALGDERGATIAEIIGRTGLSQSIVDSTLRQLLGSSLVHTDEAGERYVAADPVLFIRALADSVKDNFLDHAQMARRAAAERFDDPSAMYMTADFSCAESLQPQLVIELREMMARFVTQHEQPLGDRIANLCVAFFLRPQGKSHGDQSS
jgi:uncharacterized protein (TIGR02147 family)